MKNQGFTLIEIMVALIIFTIIASITAVSMHNILTSRERVNKQIENLTQWQIALAILEQDFKHVINRPVRTNSMQERAALQGTPNSVEFTRDGVNIVNETNLTTLQRVAWRCNSGNLVRRYWLVLDPPQLNQYHEQVFLTKLKTCKFAYLGQANQTLANWNTDTNPQGTQTITMPRAIMLTLNQNSNTALLFPISGANHA